MRELTVNLIDRNTMMKAYVFNCTEYSITDDIASLASSTFKIPWIYKEIQPTGKLLVLILEDDGVNIKHLGVLRSISNERELTSDHYYTIFEEAVNMVNIGPRNTLWTQGDYVDFCMHQHFDRFHDIPGYIYDFAYKTGRNPFPSAVPQQSYNYDESGQPTSIKQGGIDDNDASFATFLQLGYTKNQEVLQPTWESGKIVFRYTVHDYPIKWNLNDDMDCIESTSLPDMWQKDGVNAVYVYAKDNYFTTGTGWTVDNYRPAARFYKDDIRSTSDQGYDSNFPNMPWPHVSSPNDKAFTSGYSAIDDPSRTGMTGHMNIKKIYADVRTADELSDMVEPYAYLALHEFVDASVNFEVTINFRNSLRVKPSDFKIGSRFTITLNGKSYTSVATAIAYTQDERGPWTLKGGFKRETVTGLVAASKGDLTGIATINNTNKWVSTGIHARY